MSVSWFPSHSNTDDANMIIQTELKFHGVCVCARKYTLSGLVEKFCQSLCVCMCACVTAHQTPSRSKQY